MPDEHAQPPRHLRAAAVNARHIDEMIGLCRGLLADGVLVEEEARFLLDWLRRHREVADHWPANVLYSRVERALGDGKWDADEERELIETLMQIIGEPTTDITMGSMSTTLPLDHPAPEILSEGRLFCFTGRFFCGSRREVETTALALGAQICPNPIKRTHYLVIGAAGSRDWVHSSYGRKIERAVELRANGTPLAIISEEHWLTAVVSQQSAQCGN